MVEALRRLALPGTEMAQAQVSTIRLRLLKIGAPIRIPARRVLVSMASGYPFQALFAHAGAVLRCGAQHPDPKPRTSPLGALR